MFCLDGGRVWVSTHFHPTSTPRMSLRDDPVVGVTGNPGPGRRLFPSYDSSSDSPRSSGDGADVLLLWGLWLR